MGGGEITRRGKGLVVVAVTPFPENAVKETLAEIREEFPDLEYHFFLQDFTVNRNTMPGGEVEVPNGMLLPRCTVATVSQSLHLHIPAPSTYEPSTL